MTVSRTSRQQIARRSSVERRTSRSNRAWRSSRLVARRSGVAKTLRDLCQFIPPEDASLSPEVRDAVFVPEDDDGRRYRAITACHTRRPRPVSAGVHWTLGDCCMTDTLAGSMAPVGGRARRPRYDSSWERSLASDFDASSGGMHATGSLLSRETTPIASGDELFFPGVGRQREDRVVHGTAASR